MNQKSQPPSAERVNQQSAIKLQSEQKPALLVDPACEMEYIEDILTLMTRINRTQFSDANQLKHYLKTQNPIYLNLLQLITSVIDPFFEIKSFSDEKFQIFLKRLGYPCKSISKTRFLSLGSSHTYLQSIHILSWLSKQANQLITVNERLEKGQYKPVDDENLSQGQKMKKLIAEYLQYGYTQQLQESELERFYKDAKLKLTTDNQNITKEIQRLQFELNLISSQEVNLQEAQDECDCKDSEVKVVVQDISYCQQELDKIRSDLNKTMNNILQVDKEIDKTYEAIEVKKEQVAQQPVSLEKAKELEAQDTQLTAQSQVLLGQLEEIQKKIEVVREEKTDILCKVTDYCNFLNAGGVKVGTEYELFENVNLDQEPSKGIKICEEENLMSMDIEDFDIANTRKLAQVRDFLLSENGEAIQRFILPQNNQLNEELDKKIEDTNLMVKGEQKITQEIRMNLTSQQKQLEQIECSKTLVQQEIAALSDSTQELIVMKKIFQEQEEKQQQILKEIESKKMEIKFLKERQNLEVIEIERSKQSMQDISEQIDQLQKQAETVEEQNILMIQNFKDWVNSQLDNFQQFVNSND